MTSQVTRPQNHSKKKNRAKTNKSKRKRKGTKSRLLHKTGGGMLVTYPTFRTSASLSHAPPSAPDRRPAGDSSPMTSSTATSRCPSSTAPDEDPSSISLPRRISHPVLHLQGATLTFAWSIAPPPSPQRHLDLPHRNRSTLTNSTDEAEAHSVPPRRFCTHRCILSFIRSHGAAGALYRAAMAGLHRRRRHRPLHPRRLSPMLLVPRQRLPH